MRIYEAFNYRTIPIILGDGKQFRVSIAFDLSLFHVLHTLGVFFLFIGAIQAFEKFIDWTDISVKLNGTTWHNEDNRNGFRRMVRNASEEFRAAYLSDYNHRAILNRLNPVAWGSFDRMRRNDHEEMNWMHENSTDAVTKIIKAKA
jgi:hypothetical protein